MEQHLDIKKRLMFVKGEDFYFLTYNSIILLHLLGCYCGDRKFIDYRKLAFLIDFVADYNLTKIVRQNGSDKTALRAGDRELLMRTYSTGMLRLNLMIRLLFTLEKKGFVTLERNQNSSVVDVCLNNTKLVTDLLDESLFRIEIENVLHLKKRLLRLNNLSLETMLKRLFDDYGISRWAIY